MPQRSILERRPSTPDIHALPEGGRKFTCNRFWPQRLGAVALCVLSLTWTVSAVAAPDQAGFTQQCSGFAQDPLLGPLWPGTLEQTGEKRSTALTTMVPRLSLHGTALATYEARQAA